jgi:LmbE family N-acetylglucosaminyl deacetylase
VPSFDGAGTPEAQWQAWPALHRWPRLPLDAAPPRAVVVAPHPGDELLGVGGLMARLAEAGSELVVVAVTDGENTPSPVATSREPARVRAEERERALHLLGLSATVEPLHLPDGEVAAHAYELSGALAELLRDDDWCLATWSGDGHPDHESTGRAAAAGCRVAGARLVEFPLWAWHWAVPEDERVPWGRARRVELAPPQAEAKRRAAAPVLPPDVLARLTRDSETVFV